MYFKNTVIVMTSNLGSHEIMNRQGEDPAEIKEAVMDEVKKDFRPEFINRIDEIVVFNALDEKAIREIARIQIRKLARRMEAQNIGLEVSDAALDEIGKVGFDPLFGARPLRRAVQEYLENKIAINLLKGQYAPGDTVDVDYKDGKFIFSKKAI